MNRHHLATFLWLRWRLAVNQMRKAGTISFALSMIFIGIAVMSGTAAFVIAFVVGVPMLGQASPLTILLVWDVIVLGFLLFWTSGVIAELQRLELLGIDKFLHLPVTLGGVFLMNYLATFFSLSLIVLVPTLTGLILALCVTHGPIMLVVFLPTVALVFAVTAVTYQFRGWLAAMMTDPRRRRFVISFVTMVFILIVQIPNLVNLSLQPRYGEPEDLAALHNKHDELRKAQPNMDGEAFLRENAKIVAEINERSHAHLAERKAREHLLSENFASGTAIANAVVPLGWLPYAAMAATEGRVGPSLIAALALSLVAAASLRRSFLTTIRMHTGQYSSGKGNAAPRPATPAPASGRILLVERSVPGLSEHASAIAMATFRSFLRAPEAKIMLMTPVVMALIFAALFLTRSVRPPPELRPLVAFGALASALFGISQMLVNPFGLDRGGFRALVLSSASRRDVLLGKNLSFVPIAVGLQAVLVTLIQIVLPMRIDHFLALIPQAATMFLGFCLLANLAAIIAPTALSPGTLRPVGSSGTAQLIRLAFGLASPFVLALALVPYGLELLLSEVWGMTGPIALELALVEAVLAILIYRVALGWEGRLLERRELDILAVVAAKAE